MRTLPESIESGAQKRWRQPPARRHLAGHTPSARTTAWLALLAFGVLGLGLGLENTARAQPRRGGGAPAERRDGDGASDTTERREQIKKKIRAMRAYTLTEELELDEQTAGKLFPVLSRYDDETDKLLEKRVDVQRQLRHVDSLKDAKAIERLLDEAIANQRGFRDLEDRRLADLRKILRPVQTAKLLVVLPALERKIQKQLRKAIVKHHTSGSADDDDDDAHPDERAPSAPRPQRREAPPVPRAAPSNAPGNTPPCTPNAEPCR